MSAPEAPAVQAESAPMSTSGVDAVDRSQRRSRLLTVAVVLAVLLALVTAVLRGNYRDGPLEPDAPTAQGSRAVVSVLKDLGTDVDVQRHTEDAAQSLRAGRSVLVTDPNGLSGQQLNLLADAAASPGSGRLLLVAPSMIALSYVGTSIAPAGQVREATTIQADAHCGEAAFRARRVHLPGPSDDNAFPPSIQYRAPSGATCFGPDDTGLVAVEGDLVVLGSADLLANATVRDADNSAVALNALGADEQLTWYVPSSTDPMAGNAPDLFTHMPRWAGPISLWIVVMTLMGLMVAAFRLGPVVVEPLPVAVRAQELVLGRARLLQRGSQREAAASSLRAATASRLADRLGVRRERELDTLISALAPHVSHSAAELRALLAPGPVHTDQELLHLAHDLDRLEKEIDR